MNNIKKVMKKLINLRDASAYIGVSKRTLIRKISSRIIPSYKVGRLVRVDQNDLEKYLNACRVEKIT